MPSFSLIPRKVNFYDLFEKSAANLVLAGDKLADLFQNYEDVPGKVAQIADLEHQCDAITHQVMEQLHRTFVTPLDREAISLLIRSLDDVMDFIDGAAYSMILYSIARPTAQAREFVAIIVKMVHQIDQAILRLRHHAQLGQILGYCVEINRLENEADDLFRAAISELFHNSTEAIEVVKWHITYEQLESAVDRGEDVANILEGIVLEHA